MLCALARGYISVRLAWLAETTIKPSPTVEATRFYNIGLGIDRVLDAGSESPCRRAKPRKPD